MLQSAAETKLSEAVKAAQEEAKAEAKSAADGYASWSALSLHLGKVELQSGSEDLAPFVVVKYGGCTHQTTASRGPRPSFDESVTFFVHEDAAVESSSSSNSPSSSLSKSSTRVPSASPQRLLGVNNDQAVSMHSSGRLSASTKRVKKSAERGAAGGSVSMASPSSSSAAASSAVTIDALCDDISLEFELWDESAQTLWAHNASAAGVFLGRGRLSLYALREKVQRRGKLNQVPVRVVLYRRGEISGTLRIQVRWNDDVRTEAQAAREAAARDSIEGRGSEPAILNSSGLTEAAIASSSTSTKFDTVLDLQRLLQAGNANAKDSRRVGGTSEPQKESDDSALLFADLNQVVSSVQSSAMAEVSNADELGAGSAVAASASQGPRHRALLPATTAPFTLCEGCSEVLWGVYLQAVVCADCHAPFHAHCQARAYQSTCSPSSASLLSVTASKTPIGQSSHVKSGIRKRGRKLARAAQNASKRASHLQLAAVRLARLPLASAEHVLALVTWASIDFPVDAVATEEDATDSEWLRAPLREKRLQADAVSALLSTLRAPALFARLAASELIAEALSVSANARAMSSAQATSALVAALRSARSESREFSAEAAKRLKKKKNKEKNGEPPDGDNERVKCQQCSLRSAKHQVSLKLGASLAVCSPCAKYIVAVQAEVPVVERCMQLLLECLQRIANVAGDRGRAALAAAGGIPLLLQLARDYAGKHKGKSKKSHSSGTPRPSPVIQRLIGSLLIQFYDQQDIWSEIGSAVTAPDAFPLMLEAASAGVAHLHRAIDGGDVRLGGTIYESPLCTVRQGRWKGASVAVKAFSPEAMSFTWSAFHREVAMLAIAQHPRTIRLYGANDDPEAPFIVTEHCPRSIEQMIEAHCADFESKQCAGDSVSRSPIPNLLVARVGLGVAEGLAFLHSMGIIHRDVKAANFMLTEEDEVRMIDFGVSRMVAEDGNMTVVGTVGWMSPEVAQGEEYGQPADVYGWAMLMTHLLTGRAPFDDVPALLVAKQAADGTRPPLPASESNEVDDDTVPVGLLELIVRAWDQQPSKRPSSSDLARQMIYMLRATVAREVSRKTASVNMFAALAGGGRGGTSVEAMSSFSLLGDIYRLVGRRRDCRALASTCVLLFKAYKIYQEEEGGENDDEEELEEVEDEEGQKETTAGGAAAALKPAQSRKGSSSALPVSPPTSSSEYDEVKLGDSTHWGKAWFHGPLNKAEAQARLSGQPIGTFLVRNSSLPRCYVISGVFESNKMLHILLSPLDDSSGNLTGYKVDVAGDNRQFASLDEAVKAYETVLKHPAPKK